MKTREHAFIAEVMRRLRRTCSRAASLKLEGATFAAGC
jgi:hypothetical protein